MLKLLGTPVSYLASTIHNMWIRLDGLMCSMPDATEEDIAKEKNKVTAVDKKRLKLERKAEKERIKEEKRRLKELKKESAKVKK